MGRVSYCRDCKDQIIFVQTENGRNMPCDINMVPYIEDPNGKSKVLTRGGKMISCELNIPIESSTAFGYIPHFKSCRAKNVLTKGSENSDRK